MKKLLSWSLALTLTAACGPATVPVLSIHPANQVGPATPCIARVACPDGRIVQCQSPLPFCYKEEHPNFGVRCSSYDAFGRTFFIQERCFQ